MAETEGARDPGAGGRAGDLHAISRFARRIALALLLASIATVAFVMVARAGTVLLLIFGGVLFALFLSGAAGALKQLVPLPYGVLLAMLVLVLLGLVALLVVLLGPRLLDQASELATSLPRSAAALFGDDRVRSFLVTARRLRWSGLTREIETALAAARGVVTGMLEVLGGVVLFLFLGIYGAAQPAVYRKALLRLVPIPGRPRAAEVLATVVRSLRRWLYGRLVAMVFVGVGTGIVFWALGVPLPLALGLLAGLLTFIEYIGAILSAAPAILLALDKSFGTAVWVAVLFTVVHVAEGYLLTPLLARRTVRFPPAFTLGLQLVLGMFFGIAGLMLATPVAVVIVLLVRMLYVEDRLGDREPEPSAAPET